jgi:hypothetical protein
VLLEDPGLVEANRSASRLQGGCQETRLGLGHERVLVGGNRLAGLLGDQVGVDLGRRVTVTRYLLGFLAAPVFMAASAARLFATKRGSTS